MGVFFSFSLFIRLIRIHLYAYKEYRLWWRSQWVERILLLALVGSFFHVSNLETTYWHLFWAQKSWQFMGSVYRLRCTQCCFIWYGMAWHGRMPYDCCWVKAVGLVQHRVLSCNYTRVCVLKNGASAGTDVLHFLVLICDGNRNQRTEHVECRTQRI